MQPKKAQSALAALAQPTRLKACRRLVAAHPSVGIGAGAGGSAAARLSVDHPAARDYAARVGAHLRWHGGLTLDYFHIDGQPQFIECNPRIQVEHTVTEQVTGELRRVAARAGHLLDLDQDTPRVLGGDRVDGAEQELGVGGEVVCFVW